MVADTLGPERRTYNIERSIAFAFHRFMANAVYQGIPMKRHPAWILAAVMAALVALFFGYEVPDRIMIDGFSTEGTGLTTLMNTQYSDDYSHAGFRRIRVGMSEQEVLAILGEPLSRLGPMAYGVERFPEKGYYTYFIYSSPPNLRNTNYRSRVVTMDNGVVADVSGHFVAD